MLPAISATVVFTYNSKGSKMSDLYRIEDDGTVVTTTASGWDCECMPVADLLLRVGANIVDPPEPEAPTYTITGVGGAEEQRTHTAESIIDDKTPDDERLAWTFYLEQLEEWEAHTAELDQRRGELRGRFMALRGVKVRGLPDDLQAWANEQQLLYGFEIADDGLPHDKALLLAFIDQEIIRTPTDGAKVTAGILRASGLDQEALDAAEASFLDSLGQTGRTNTDGDTPVLAETDQTEE